MELPHPNHRGTVRGVGELLPTGKFGGHRGCAPPPTPPQPWSGHPHTWGGPWAQPQPGELELQLSPAHLWGSRVATAKESIGARSPSKPLCHISPVAGSMPPHKADPQRWNYTTVSALAKQGSGWCRTVTLLCIHCLSCSLSPLNRKGKKNNF